MHSMERLQLAQPTRYPIEHVFADAVRQLGRKKAIEIRQMHRFLEELELPDDGVLVSGETPDFTYETAGRRIGIEIRTLFDNRPVKTQFDRVFVFEEDSGESLHEVATIALRPD